MAVITRQQQQLDQLSLRVKQLSALSLQVNSSHTTIINYKLRDRALFYPGLFVSKGHDLSLYIAELDHNMARLTQHLSGEDETAPSAGDKRQLQAQVLLEKVAHQFRALNATLQQCHFHTRANHKTITAADSKPDYTEIAKKLLRKSHHLYHKLDQQIEYERRLQVMVDQQTDPVLRQQTQQRLQRCQTATEKVRQQVQRYEKKKDLG